MPPLATQCTVAVLPVTLVPDGGFWSGDKRGPTGFTVGMGLLGLDFALRQRPGVGVRRCGFLA